MSVVDYLEKRNLNYSVSVSINVYFFLSFLAFFGGWVFNLFRDATAAYRGSQARG